jgi:SulP family sulfate permease
VALLVATAVVQLFDLPVATIGSRFGSVPSTLPIPKLPTVPWSSLPALVPSAISIALLGGIESLLSAVVADGMTGRRHRSNAELVAQGVANLITPLFGGIPATGAIARTATNVKNGARTPVAGMVHAVTLLAILLFAGSWASLIPMPCLAAILLVVAYNMSEWRVFLNIFKSPRSDVLVMLVTFGLTVVLDLAVAIQAGMVLAAFLFMRRMVEVTEVRALQHLDDEEEDEAAAGAQEGRRGVAGGIPDRVEIFEIQGSFCFGAAQKFSEVMAQTGPPPKAIILRMRHVLAVDATGLRALEEVLERCRTQETALLFSGIQAQPLAALRRSGFLDRLGAENLYPTLAAAVAAFRQRSPASGTAPEE